MSVKLGRSAGLSCQQFCRMEQLSQTSLQTGRHCCKCCCLLARRWCGLQVIQRAPRRSTGGGGCGRAAGILASCSSMVGSSVFRRIRWYQQVGRVVVYRWPVQPSGEYVTVNRWAGVAVYRWVVLSSGEYVAINRWAGVAVYRWVVLSSGEYVAINRWAGAAVFRWAVLS